MGPMIWPAMSGNGRPIGTSLTLETPMIVHDLENSPVSYGAIPLQVWGITLLKMKFRSRPIIPGQVIVYLCRRTALSMMRAFGV